MAWLAVVLNAVAPWLAYASLAARHTPPAHAHHAMHHAALHDAADHDSPQLDVRHSTQLDSAHHAAHHGAAVDDDARPVTPHCQYCPDFAAGAPLSLAIATTLVASLAEFDVPSGDALPAHVKPFNRLAYPRGPPHSFA
jgi:hypothetical protein